MATFAPRPTEFEYPYWDTREAYDVSLENAVNQVEADVALKASASSVTALTGRVTATETVANAALPVKGSLSVGVNLDTLTTAGVWFFPADSSATLELNFPFAGVGYAIEVLPIAGTRVIQRAIPQSGVNAGRGFSVRRLNGGAWSTWQFIPTQRVDNTAGRAVYMWDPTANREQLIYGDTGIRECSALLTNGWTATNFQFRRLSEYLVEVKIVGLNGSAATSTTLMATPAGLTHGSGVAPEVVITGATGVSSGKLTIGANITANALTVSGNGREIYGTTVAWISTVPGTAVGTIPNA